MNNDYLTKINNELKQIKTEAVRDLAWVIAAPPLFDSLPNSEIKLLDSSFFEKEFERILPQIKILDNNPNDLLDFISKENTHLLGKYFEALIKYWLINFSEFQLVKSNLQIFQNKRTIGEIDFLITDKNGNLFHLEIAGKYYIARGNSNKWENFYGPNPADNLAKKMEKLLNEQVKLLTNSFAKETLDGLNITQTPTPLLLVKGYFFYVWNKSGKITPPVGSSKNHLYGWKVKSDEAKEFFGGKSSLWMVLKRRQWISRRFFVSEKEILNTDSIKKFIAEYFPGNNYPLLIARIEREGNFYFEKERAFVTKNEM